MESKREWLTTEAAAGYLQIHGETMRRWAREGLLPSVKLGNRGGFRCKLARIIHRVPRDPNASHEGCQDAFKRAKIRPWMASPACRDAPRERFIDR